MVIGGRIHTVRGSPVRDSDFAHTRREAKIQWLGLSTHQQRELAVKISKLDVDSVVRMKMATKRRVEKGQFDEDDVKMFYEDMDVWIKELSVRLQGGTPDEVLNPMQKAILIKYARDMVQ
jgi:hypothetical protein